MKTRDQTVLSEYQADSAMRNMIATIDELQLAVDNFTQTLAQKQEEIEALNEALKQALQGAQNQPEFVEEEVEILEDSEEESFEGEPKGEEISGLDSTSTIPSAHTPLPAKSAGENSANKYRDLEPLDGAVTSKLHLAYEDPYIMVGPKDKMLEILRDHEMIEEEAYPAQLQSLSPE